MWWIIGLLWWVSLGLVQWLSLAFGIGLSKKAKKKILVNLGASILLGPLYALMVGIFIQDLFVKNKKLADTTAEEALQLLFTERTEEMLNEMIDDVKKEEEK